MNKLFIIGNGFDLAHGYPTSYSHFVKWIWNNIHKDPYNEKFRKLIEIDLPQQYFTVIDTEHGTNLLNCYSDFEKIAIDYTNNQPSSKMGGMIGFRNHRQFYSFRNKFFYTLCITYPDAKWSDIESLFYTTLIEVLQEKRPNGIDIDTLNADMEVIKDLFSEYLLENVKYSNLQRVTPFTQLLEYAPKYMSRYEVNGYLNEFPKELHEQLRNFEDILVHVDDKRSWEGVNQIPSTLILDFNYTSTIKNYLSLINPNYYLYGNIEHIKIHGELNNSKNPINLGFGDEMDDHYRILEKKNDNRYLKYIKSFMYSNNTNYRKLLNWIDSNDFQVYVLGHSCGLSDRIMLNTIFEKDKCKSIKVFYYEWDQDGKVYDDFTDKIQNISRHFNKKASMREKLVDKSLSQPLKVI